LQVECRAVNSRFLDLGFRLPDECRGAEPLLREMATQAMARGKRSNARPSGSLSVLAVEDNPSMVALYEKTFVRCAAPVTLHVASDAAEALLLIERTRPMLIITDLVMEPFDGFHLLKVLPQATT
jgi:PleD family two-component response regulator